MKKILSTPVARAMAKKLNIDITKVIGTGPNNRVMKSDIATWNKSEVIETKKQPKETINVSKVETTMEDKRIKASPLRKGIAKALKNSWNQVAYVNLVSEVNVTNLWDLRKKIKDPVLEKTGVKLTFLPFIVLATIKAIQKYPIFNAKYDSKTEEIVYKKEINIGIAVDTDKGLLVPVIKNANNMSVVEISREIIRLAKACKDGTIKPSEMRDSTYTITNYGSVDALFGVPVINHPNLAITGMGTIKDKVYIVGDEMKPGKVLYLTTAGDHQWVDGGDIGRFNYEIRILLENPEVLLALQ
ncbi:2-oxo acid dehydrogenase subunit E2 [Mycoplasma marinum]|uniref:Dihydrolipoamide acetyltransferase n=1 Tax=Mycoplasma marinum TaxID=1937190 RepID=A0A4R0XMG4_9MOLU|nr:2-oxo acid dehydrogenase subunit E2 [Mycoplasma marinum]TCG11899.1 dihydrolipoamide acetyltransferase [Mycoplasma marinum]